MPLYKLALASIIALMLAGCNDNSEPSFKPVSAGPEGWTIAYSPSMPSTMSGPPGAYTFDFPLAAGGPEHSDGVHYVIERAPPIRLGQTITMVFSLEGDGKLVATQGEASARVRLFMQRSGDELTEDEPYKRWWSRAFIELRSPGTYILTAKVTHGEWMPVLGVPSEGGFADCVANLANVGFTFGGIFAGHGVYVTDGAVRFILKEFRIS